MLHDGEADALHIHQTLGQPGVISVCSDCQPMYLITALADAVQVDAGGLYEAVRAYQLAVQQDGEPPAAPDAADDEPMPEGPHPVLMTSSGSIAGWGWCACDAPGPHDSDGAPVMGDLLAELREETCPHCPEVIRGTARDIDSGIRKHLEYCPQAPADASGEDA